MENLTYKEIVKKTADIKKNAKKIYSNYLPLTGDPENKKFRGYTGKSTIVYINEKNIVHRIVFFSSEKNELIHILKKCPRGLGLDLPSKTRRIKDDYLTEAGFYKVATLQRLLFHDGTMQDEELMRNDKFRAMYQHRNDALVEYAKESDTEEIFLLLQEVFNPYIDHLPTKEEIVENFIKQNGVLVYRLNNKILTLMAFTVSGKRMFLQYIINKSGNYKILAALMVYLRDIALERKMKLMYSFVELSENRKSAVKYYERRGTEFDNFYNHVYTNVDRAGEVALKELIKKSEIENLLSALRADVENCLYIYIDLMKYGIENPNMKVWQQINDDGSILVVMKYHDGFQLYSNQIPCNTECVVELIQEYSPERISGNEPVIRNLHPAVKDRYESVYGAVFCHQKEPACGNTKGNTIEDHIGCRLAEYKDIPDIVDLMLTEEEFREQYSREELISQLEERYRTAMGRSMIVREDGRIVGHIGSFAETEDIAVISGSVMRQGYRNTDYYHILSEVFFDLICRTEQKNAYYFATNRRHMKYYEKVMGSCANYGKLIKCNK